MVLTDEVQQDKYPTATLETAKLATEKNYYDIQDAQVVNKSEATGITDYVNDNGIGNNPSDPTFEGTNSAKLYKLNSGTAKTGLGMTLKVMAGDKIDVFGKSYYFTNTSGTGGNSTVPVLDLLTAFLNAPSAASAIAGKGAVTASGINTAGGIGGITSMMTQQNSQSNAAPNKPRAFINVIFFDEQFKTYDGGFSISMVGSNSVVKDHFADLQNLVAGKSGFVYIYCSNESPVNVFFDNIQVVHTRGQILEETHYYPFGLTMSGISSKSAGSLTNKNKYNGKEEQRQEFSDGSGLEWVDYGARMYDGQIGRWVRVDNKAEKYLQYSTYCYGINNPIKYLDFDGNEIGNPNDPFTKKVQYLLNKTQLGQELWVRMEASNRKIYFRDIRKDNSTEASNLGIFLGKKGAITMSKTEYANAISGKETDLNIRGKFNPDNGMYDKTSDWDETYVVVKTSIGNWLQQINLLTKKYGLSFTNEFEESLLWVLSHESLHTVQNYLDLKEKEKDKKTGKFIEKPGFKFISWDKRMNEQECEAEAMKILDALYQQVMDERNNKKKHD